MKYLEMTCYIEAPCSLKSFLEHQLDFSFVVLTSQIIFQWTNSHFNCVRQLMSKNSKSVFFNTAP